jgi:hypothetical protein
MRFIKRWAGRWVGVVVAAGIAAVLICALPRPREVLASGISNIVSVFGQVGVVNIPVTTTDISTPGSPPSSGKTIWYTKAGTLCSLSPGNVENCTGSTAGVFYQTVENGGSSLTQQPVINFQNGITCANGSSVTNCNPTTNQQAQAIGGGFDGGGSALTSGSTATTYFTVPFACTIAAWNITVDTGTITFDVWKIATGTAIPTVANTITASALPAISSGTAVHSTTLTGWTTAVAANDVFGININTVATATKASLVLQCNKTT